MGSFWYAECAPCGWSESHGVEDAAIGAAEMHIGAKHPTMSATERAAKRVGTVTQRDENAFAVEAPAAAAPAEEAPAAAAESEAVATPGGEV